MSTCWTSVFTVEQDNIEGWTLHITVISVYSSAPGLDYIEFIQLTENDGVILKFVLPDEEGQDIGDYFSDPIFVDQGIPIGARDQLTTVLYVRN